jgi:hypothetical protein
MSYSVRHQVFFSSTFTDLVEERTEVIQALWELDCIPTGMEAFVASNEGQWEVIRKVIDECDYYVLIIGGRYGSITHDGISYTEKEYRYAKKVGLPVLAFVHASPESIAVGKTDKDEQNRIKLESFRTEVMSEYPVRSWSSAFELGGLVSRSVVREIKVTPRPGWVRNDGSSPVVLLERINDLTEENHNLHDQLLLTQNVEVDEGLESGEDEIELHGTRLVQSVRGTNSEIWSALVSWDEMFRDIGPRLINETTETDLQSVLARFHSYDEFKDGENFRGLDRLNPESWNEILIQFRALGLIEQGVKKRGINDNASYWRITQKGDRHLVNLLARRKRLL